MPERGSFDVTDVAFHQTIERGIGRDNVLRLWRPFFLRGHGRSADHACGHGRCCESQSAASRHAVAMGGLANLAHSLSSQAGFLPRTILVAVECKVNLEGPA